MKNHTPRSQFRIVRVTESDPVICTTVRGPYHSLRSAQRVLDGMIRWSGITGHNWQDLAIHGPGLDIKVLDIKVHDIKVHAPVIQDQ